MKKKLLKKVHCIEKGCTFAPTNDASVAQLVEHLTLNQGVQGSTPCQLDYMMAAFTSE